MERRPPDGFIANLISTIITQKSLCNYYYITGMKGNKEGEGGEGGRHENNLSFLPKCNPFYCVRLQCGSKNNKYLTAHSRKFDYL